MKCETYAAISRPHKLFSKIIERAPFRMPLILAKHIPDVENVRIIDIYQRYKLSDIKYALTDVTSYAGHVGTSE